MSNTNLLILELLLLFFIFTPIVFTIAIAIYVTIKWKKGENNVEG